MSFTQAMMAENAELKKQLKFEKEQGAIIVHQNQALLAENTELQEQFFKTIDELESEVLDARESFNLQQQSDVLWYKGDTMCDPETGDEIHYGYLC